MRPLSRNNISTHWRKVAPGNGMWSRVHWPMACKPSMYSSFHMNCQSRAYWTRSAVGLSSLMPS